MPIKNEQFRKIIKKHDHKPQKSNIEADNFSRFS